MNEEIMFDFWNALMQKNKGKAYELFVESLKKFRERIPRLPDERSRELFTEAIDWALKYPKEIHIHNSNQDARNGHMPNMVTFPQLLGGIELQSKSWQSKVYEIKHDRQSEFEKTLKKWHKLHKGAIGKPIYFPGFLPENKKYVIRRVEDSAFVMSSATDSPGIQVSDIVLWLLKMIQQEKHLPPNCWVLAHYVSEHSHVIDLSLETASRGMSIKTKEMMSMDISEEQAEEGKRLGEKIEENRQRAMREFLINKNSEPQ